MGLGPRGCERARGLRDIQRLRPFHCALPHCGCTPARLMRHCSRFQVVASIVATFTRLRRRRPARPQRIPCHPSRIFGGPRRAGVRGPVFGRMLRGVRQSQAGVVRIPDLQVVQRVPASVVLKVILLAGLVLADFRPMPGLPGFFRHGVQMLPLVRLRGDARVSCQA